MLPDQDAEQAAEQAAASAAAAALLLEEEELLVQLPRRPRGRKPGPRGSKHSSHSQTAANQLGLMMQEMSSWLKLTQQTYSQKLGHSLCRLHHPDRPLHMLGPLI